MATIPSEEVTASSNAQDEVEISPNWALHGWNLLKRNDKYSPLPGDLKDKITYKIISDARDLIYDKGLVHKTPVIDGRYLLGPGTKNIMQLVRGFEMKCENMQCSGSFKMRGASYQFSQIEDISEECLITISAGNYGTSFATLAKELGVAQQAYVYMPKTVPLTRKQRIEAFGVSVNCNYPQESLMDGISEKQRLLRKSGMNSNFLHPFDDINVIIGHGSAGLELLEQVPDADIVLVCCGGGGFLAGVTAAIRLSGNKKTKVYGVEHTISCTMFDSLHSNKIAHMMENPSKTICHGISAPFTGQIPFKIFRALGDGVIKITEEEALGAVKLLYKVGLVVEPSGAAAVAAVLSNKVPDIEGKKVVAFITGGNVTPEELTKCGV
ncbi:probable serine racemase [Rhopilema esculentum]|uniref:probable serine racemase n=1 Tax=Rhopilema esculentum TaxID=499914 RepID=UPI0031DE5873|eukprot:gene2242-17849_t